MADELTQWNVAAETKEWVGPITVTADGIAVTSFEVAVTAPGIRPATWAAADVLDGLRGVMVGTGTSHSLIAGGKYTVWVRYTDVPEIPVQRCGTVKVY